jgi:biotin operon repressor
VFRKLPLRKSGRHACLRRCLDLIKLFMANRFGLSFADIQSALGLSRREVHRYIKALQQAGVGIKNVNPIGGRTPGRYRLMNRQEFIELQAIL